MRYPVVVHKDPNGDYGVTVPDLPGCFSAGETLDEALQEVVEAIESHLEGDPSLDRTAEKNKEFQSCSCRSVAQDDILQYLCVCT